MKSENLTDEQLFRGIARNTNAMTALIHQQLELAAVNRISDPIRQRLRMKDKVKTLREEVCEGLLEYLELLKSSTRFS